MEAAERREQIRQLLCQSKRPISAAALADNGCTVLDVIVDHPIYGQLTGPLRLASRYDVAQFIRRCEEEDAPPLSLLTEGIHLHTLSCPDEAVYERVLAALDAAGFLLK